MIINHNIAALNTHRQLGAATNAQTNNMEKLSSGLRINRAGDDAAGLAISEKMRGQIRGLDMASKNAQDGISMIQTAEGALNETHSILQRMRELSVQSSNDTNTLDDRKEIQKEVEQLKSEINRISDTTEFNTQKLLNGSLGAVGSSDDTAVIKLNNASGLKAGDYDATVTQEATVKAAAEGSTTFTAGTDYTGKELTINGVKIDFSDLDTTTATGAEIAAKINSYTEKTGVTATNGSNKITLTTEAYGSDAKLVLGGADATEFGGAVTGGDNAEVSITDENGVTEALTGLGQEVNYKGAQLTVTDTTGAGTATIKVSSSGATLQIGANKDQNVLIDINEMSTKTLGDTNVGLVKDIDLQTQDGANNAIKTLDKAIQQVSAERSKLGANQNRLEHTINNLNTSSENLTAAESRIRDVDMAKEMMEQTKNSILSQAAQAMLAQANQQPQGVLQLLR
ncbi:flagellin [Paenibacillus sp. J45TS6]|uniref:flagellin N-terminal helical domain-containing protein n=1 Tax=Paenibacillus sp. J45TS6 TaxID=2807196 RepID=UPI001B0996A7|nr:flagellin [Paenibacillus sp. J45TS6]GIP42150.1 flagellin [Paenibacillus sp. J45TS6]